MSAENWAESIPDDLSCDRCSHPYASHSHETGKCADVKEDKVTLLEAAISALSWIEGDFFKDGEWQDASAEAEASSLREAIAQAKGESTGILSPCWCRNFEPPYPPAREEL